MNFYVICKLILDLLMDLFWFFAVPGCSSSSGF